MPPPELLKSDELNDQQKAFCLYYLQRYNATWAYQKAYGGSYESALAHGPRLVGNGRIKSYLSKLKEQQSKELYVTATDILRSYLLTAQTTRKDHGYIIDHLICAEWTLIIIFKLSPSLNRSIIKP